ncbi:extracellular solute-binding protein [Actinopolymorpha sp. B9G3]|uniref:ABC transporter substrate-binding protein n=1 Tax=Actinopolymorpha sp. B9G3 TaxID=3158970 RepID=UPI0032D8CDA4
MGRNGLPIGGRLSRRDVLVALGGAGLGIGLMGCEVVTDPNAGGGPQRKKPARRYNIPDSGAKLPTGEVTFQWMDSGDLKAMFEEPLFRAYEKKHTNITIDYQDSPWERINEVVPLGVRNGTAPDVFAQPNNVPVQVMVNEGWVAPIDDLIPDFETWKKGFPDNAFISGVHIFNDRTYAWPVTSSKRWGHLLMYDREYLDQAGYDPESQPLSWDDFRAAAKKVTQQGGGDYYGLMLAGTAISGVATRLAELAGLRGDAGSGIDWKTGEFTFTAPELLDAFELLLAIKSDGSIFPGFLSLADADSRARMPQRVAGMIFDGPWDIPEWPAINPDYDFGVAMPPSPTAGEWAPASYQEVGSNQAFVFADGKHKEIAGDLFSYMGSLEGQTNIVTASEGNLSSLMPEANERARQTNLLTGRAKAGWDVANRLLHAAPMVAVRNPDTVQVILEQKPVQPALVDIAQGIFSGQVDDVKAALRDLYDRSNQALDDAIEAAQAKGAEVSRDDWVFPNWDPTKDYTPEMYDELA